MNRIHSVCALTVLSLAGTAISVAGAAHAAAPPRWTMQVNVGGSRIEGMPLDWTDEHVQVLARDGRLVEFATGKARDYRKTSSTFRPYSVMEMSAQLEREFGERLEITSTGHYLVAHPRGAGERWAERFETLYRSFLHFFRVRGLTVKEPQFPLVAIVWPTQQDFMRYAASQGEPVGTAVLGYYSPKSNRILMYDVGGGKSTTKDWRENATTIIHEATHQTAFNTGLHGRFSTPPRWLCEGLGMLFEAPGVYDSASSPSLHERINLPRLNQFRSLAANGRPSSFFAELISADRVFFQNPDAAYAEAWAFSFFLMETQPRKYGEYLARTAAREPFKPYPAAERVKDFTSIFGSNIRMLEADFLRFIEGLR